MAAAAALLLPLALAAPAAAENRAFTGVRGDASPSRDIVAYAVNYTPDQVSITHYYAAPNTDEVSVLHELDVNGDGTSDYDVFDSGVVDERTFTDRCPVVMTRTASAVGVTFPASCIGSPASLRVQVYASTASEGDAEPEFDVWSPAVARGAVVVRPRAVTIGIRQFAGVYTFSGVVSPAEAGVQVTTARLDGATHRVTGVASTRTDAAGRYTIRTRLPVGLAGYYSLTSAKSGIAPGRSRLYGLVVPPVR